MWLHWFCLGWCKILSDSNHIPFTFIIDTRIRGSRNPNCFAHTFIVGIVKPIQLVKTRNSSDRCYNFLLIFLSAMTTSYYHYSGLLVVLDLPSLQDFLKRPYSTMFCGRDGALKEAVFQLEDILCGYAQKSGVPAVNKFTKDFTLFQNRRD